MRGYYSTTGFWGLVNGSYRLFASEEDYYDMVARTTKKITLCCFNIANNT